MKVATDRSKVHRTSIRTCTVVRVQFRIFVTWLRAAVRMRMCVHCEGV